MRLSEISTDRALDVICTITPHVTAILSDAQLLAELKNAIVVDNATTAAEKFAVLGNKIAVLLPMILKNHKCDVFAIIAAINDSDIDAVAKQPVLTTMHQIKELVNDEDLMSFFA